MGDFPVPRQRFEGNELSVRPEQYSWGGGGGGWGEGLVLSWVTCRSLEQRRAWPVEFVGRLNWVSICLFPGRKAVGPLAASDERGERGIEHLFSGRVENTQMSQRTIEERCSFIPERGK